MTRSTTGRWTSRTSGLAVVWPPVHPGEILRDEFLTPMKISVYELANAIKVPRSRANDIGAWPPGDHNRHRDSPRAILRHIIRVMDQPSDAFTIWTWPIVPCGASPESGFPLCSNVRGHCRVNQGLSSRFGRDGVDVGPAAEGGFGRPSRRPRSRFWRGGTRSRSCASPGSDCANR